MRTLLLGAAYKLGLGTWIQFRRARRRRRTIDAIRHSGEALTAVDAALDLLRLYDLLPPRLVALEPFGMFGLWKTPDYLPLCESLDLFEIDPRRAELARRHLPSSVVTVHPEDSIRAVQECRTPRHGRYDFVLVDNGMGFVYGPGDSYCEGQDLFPALYDCLADEAVLLNVFLTRRPPGEFSAEYLRRRRAFFGAETDEEALAPDAARVEGTYRSLLPTGMRLRRAFFVPHPSVGEDSVLFLVLGVTRVR